MKEQEDNKIKTRLFIESDILHKEELDSSKNHAELVLNNLKQPFIDDIFDTCIDFAWHNIPKTWDLVKKHDQIWADSSLMPLSGGSYIGSPLIFNKMMEKAIEEDIRGKDVFILRQLKDIYWGMIDLKLIKTAFKHNNLYFVTEEFDKVKKFTLKDLSSIKK